LIPGCSSSIRFSPRANGFAAAERASRSSCWSKPTGTSRVIWSNMRFSFFSSMSFAVSESRVAIMPQPMSTPTAPG
jgi:hypothetical protein